MTDQIEGGTMIRKGSAMSGTTLFGVLAALASLAIALSKLPPAYASDLCESSTPIPGVPYSETRDTSTATTSASDPVVSCTGSLGSNSVWYSFTPATSGVVTAFTDGSSYDTVLVVYTGNCGALVEQACNDDTLGAPHSQVTFSVVGGTTYRIEVTGFQSAGGGTLQFGLTSVRPADNDECGSPTPIETVPFYDIVDASAATTSASDPPQSCTLDGPVQNAKSVWYGFTPASDGVVTASTLFSGYDTVLTAYTGTCGALTEVGCNDDLGNALQSEVSFAVTGGMTYLFEVTEYETAAATTLHFALEFAPSAAIAKAAEKCQRTLRKAGLTLVTKRLASLGKCADGVFTCVQAKPNDKRDACVMKAGRKCAGELAKTTNEQGKFVGKVLKACDEGLVSFANLTGSTGLGYDAVSDECKSEFGMPAIADTTDVAECVVRQHECRSDQLLGTEEPRAKELIGIALAAQVPPVSIEGLGCLTDNGGTGLDIDDQAKGKALENCERTIKKAALKFAKTKLTGLGKCVDALFACQQSARGNLGCMAKARGTCDQAFLKIDGAARTLDLAIDKKCLEPQVSYETLRASNGAHIDALGPECAAHEVASLASIEGYKQCLFRQHECRVEELLRFAVPRAESLLKLAGRPLFSAFCPSQ